ncbi:hypothetical protein ACGFY9_06905 [Streptomyces sp. NPDC048504]
MKVPNWLVPGDEERAQDGVPFGDGSGDRVDARAGVPPALPERGS